jgi:hypothetical protein
VRPIRLLQLVHGYPPAVGGVEIATRDRVERLVADHGFEVTVATTNCYTVAGFRNRSEPTIPIRTDEVQNGVRVRRFPVRAALRPALHTAARIAYRARLPGNDVLRTLASGPISPGMLRAVRTFRPDVICAASFPLNHIRYPFRLPEPRPPVVLIGAIHTNDDWRRPDAWLAIAGSTTPFTERLRQLLRELPREARERVTLLTDVDGQTKADLLGDCDVFASPSQAESFRFTTVEAWSVGKPVVVGDAPSQRSVVEEGVTGFVVPHGEREPLVEALEQLADLALRAAMGSRAARRRAVSGVSRERCPCSCRRCRRDNRAKRKQARSGCSRMMGSSGKRGFR